MSQVLEFAGRVGFPLILKPIAGAGAADTVKVNSVEELKQQIIKDSKQARDFFASNIEN